MKTGRKAPEDYFGPFYLGGKKPKTKKRFPQQWQRMNGTDLIMNITKKQKRKEQRNGIKNKETNTGLRSL